MFLFFFVSAFVGMIAIVADEVQPKKNDPKVKYVTETREYIVHQWGRCDWYYDKNGCLRMRKCRQKSKDLPSIWKPKDGVCAR